MKKYKLRVKRLLLVLLVFIVLSVLGIIIYYKTSLGSVSSSDADKEIIIEKGSSSKIIAKTLKKYSLIKNEFTFLVYIKLNNISDLKYGTYLMSENMGVEKIVELLQEGSTYNPDEVTITFKEGINMREIATIISSKTVNSYDDVIAKSNDIEYIQKLKEKYWFITDSLNDSNLYYKLEGYLYPNTYKLTNKEVSVEYIFDKMLNEMNNVLKPYQEEIEKSKLSIHQILTLASMVEKEAAKKEDRSQVASVFMNRIKRGMSLGSDVTTRYAFKVDNPKQVLTKVQYNTRNPYNTRITDGSMNGKLPVGPICALSESSIKASVYPSDTDYIYFIANIQTLETFFYNNAIDFEKKKGELASVNGGF